MTTLETIHVRFAGEDLRSLIDLIRASADAETEDLKVRIFRHARINNDMVVHLLWNQEREVVEESHLGQRLAAMLREHAMVEHSVWRGIAESDAPDGSEGKERRSP